MGYSPFNNPISPSPIFPFNDLFDGAANLMFLDSLNNVDAIVLWGGTDISSKLYNQPKHIKNSGPTFPSDRDLFEWQLMREAVEKKKPIIGVCRGAQIICAFAGGKLVQDCTGHGIEHQIDTYDDKSFYVTSSHHQMMYPFDVNHEMLAWSTRKLSYYYHGITTEEERKLTKEPEVVYFPDINAMAIQCHPEWHTKDTAFNSWVIEQITNKCFN